MAFLTSKVKCWHNEAVHTWSLTFDNADHDYVFTSQEEIETWIKQNENWCNGVNARIVENQEMRVKMELHSIDEIIENWMRCFPAWFEVHGQKINHCLRVCDTPNMFILEFDSKSRTYDTKRFVDEIIEERLMFVDDIDCQQTLFINELTDEGCKCQLKIVVNFK